jgi:hypothetical protein
MRPPPPPPPSWWPVCYYCLLALCDHEACRRPVLKMPHNAATIRMGTAVCHDCANKREGEPNRWPLIR